MIQITNLTPHPVTIHRTRNRPLGSTDDRESYVVTYPACAPADLPRATEGPYRGDMAITRSDGQGHYENANSLDATGVVDFLGYTGVDGLPPLSRGDQMFGVGHFYIVSIVTAIGAAACGRGIEDLLIPCGQVRDEAGRIIGASGLAPATSLLSPLYRAWTAPLRVDIMSLARELNEARLQAAERA